MNRLGPYFAAISIKYVAPGGTVVCKARLYIQASDVLTGTIDSKWLWAGYRRNRSTLRVPPTIERASAVHCQRVLSRPKTARKLHAPNP